LVRLAFAERQIPGGTIDKTMGKVAPENPIWRQQGKIAPVYELFRAALSLLY
jgi:hypothetical protein